MPDIRNDDVKIYKPRFSSFTNTSIPVIADNVTDANSEVKLYDPLSAELGKIWVDDNKK